MSNTESILQTARQRAQTLQVPYTGTLTPPEAHQVKEASPDAILLDVRSVAEWQFVGTIPYAKQLEWRSFPGMVINPDFLAQLAEKIDKSDLLMLLCRTGSRSDEVARLVHEAGYQQVYNVLEGFEGDKDSEGHRGSSSGWKAHQLPWQQS